MKDGRTAKARQPRDEEIDTSDIPALTRRQLKRARRVGRPLIGVEPRMGIHIRIDRGVLKKLKARAKREGIGYQSLINEILKKAI